MHVVCDIMGACPAVGGPHLCSGGHSVRKVPWCTQVPPSKSQRALCQHFFHDFPFISMCLLAILNKTGISFLWTHFSHFRETVVNIPAWLLRWHHLSARRLQAQGCLSSSAPPSRDLLSSARQTVGTRAHGEQAL